MKRHCTTHGSYEEGLWSDACPQCKEMEERDEARHQVAERLIHEDRKSAEMERQRTQKALERGEILAREAREQEVELAREKREYEEELDREARELDREARELDREDRERKEELDRELAENAVYEQANPGDYECPFCLFITLKRNARVCIKCRRDIPASYWAEIQRQEEADARAKKLREAAELEKWKREQSERLATAAVAAEEWKRKEPERLAAAAAAKKEQERLAAEKERERLAAETKVNSKKRLMATLGWLHLIWAVPLSGFLGAVVGMIAGWIITLVFMRNHAISLENGANIGAWTGGIICLLIVFIIGVFNTRKILPGTDELQWPDILAITIAFFIAICMISIVFKESMPSKRVVQLMKNSPIVENKISKNTPNISPKALAETDNRPLAANNTGKSVSDGAKPAGSIAPLFGPGALIPETQYTNIKTTLLGVPRGRSDSSSDIEETISRIEFTPNGETLNIHILFRNPLIKPIEASLSGPVVKGDGETHSFRGTWTGFSSEGQGTCELAANSRSVFMWLYLSPNNGAPPRLLFNISIP